jgi:hypothetical protein
MQKALEIPEILERIFERCERSSIKECAQVRTQWSDIALNLLWREVTSLGFLLTPLGNIKRAVEGTGDNGRVTPHVRTSSY